MLGPLSRLSEPHAYDLCREHASRMTAPRGWELLRVAGAEEVSDDIVALADAVRRRPAPETDAAPGTSGTAPRPERTPTSGPRPVHRAPGPGEQTSPRHLHVVRNPRD